MMPTGLRAKLAWAYIVMSVVPLVVLLLVAAWFAFPRVRDFYHLDRWFPLIASPDSAWWLIGVLLLTVMVSLLGGLYLTLKVVDPVIRLSRGASKLAHGDCNLALPAADQDELGELTRSLNQLTSRIRQNLVELKHYGEQTSHLNLEIHNRVLCLSGLLQVGELIGAGAPLDVILDTVTEQVASIDEQQFSFLLLQPLPELSLTLRRACRLDASRLSAMPCESIPTVIDAKHPAPDSVKAAWERLDRPNLILQPVLLHNRLVGVLGLGNRLADAAWPEELVDLIRLFVKQTAIAIESALLAQRARVLSTHDEATGVYNETYMCQRLAEEIQRAVMYQRPCAYALFAIHGLAEFGRRRGEPDAERVLRRAARLIQESLSEVDRVARVNGSELGVLLPERSKREALEIVREIRRRVERQFIESDEDSDGLRIACGVAENPLDGATAEELMTKASSILRQPESEAAGR